MLTNAGTRQSRRPPRSLRAEYDLFIEQRIEEYKDSLPRGEILEIGDEAMKELAGAEQFLLTEVVLRDHVDAIIRRRLKLPAFRRWRDKYVALRAAQSEPSHWGLAPHEPAAELGRLMEDDDTVLVVGATDGACALYLAARGASVRVADPDIAAVYGLENRAMTEQLGGRIECEVVRLDWFDPNAVRFCACVLELSALALMGANERAELIRRIKEATPEGGRHAIMAAGHDGAKGTRLSSDALRSHYVDWEVIKAAPAPSGRKPRPSGFTAIRPRGEDAQ
jgi:hypothetical protein